MILLSAHDSMHAQTVSVQSNNLFIIWGLLLYKTKLGHVDKVLITTCLGSRGLEKKIVVYISTESIGDFLAIVKVNKG